MEHNKIHQLTRIESVCTHGAADWEDVEGTDAVLKGPWTAYKTPACYDRSPVISERYSSRTAPVWDVTGGDFFTDRFFFLQKDERLSMTCSSNSYCHLQLLHEQKVLSQKNSIVSQHFSKYHASKQFLSVHLCPQLLTDTTVPLTALFYILYVLNIC